MAYTPINKPTDYFNTKLYTGTGSSNALTGIGFQPDWVWLKSRSAGWDHEQYDSVRGVGKSLSSVTTNAEQNSPQGVTVFGADGFTVGTRSGVNENNSTYVSWNWLAGGTAPAITYTVKVVSDGGNKYRFNDFGTSAVTLDLQEGGTYTFDQSDSSNSGHPLRFSTTSNGTHGGGSEYTTGVTTVGTAGSSGAKTIITVGSGVATLYYYCTQHSGMGGQANTNSTFGSSNFGGSIQSNVSANTTAGFSIVSYTGNGSTGKIGHGLNSTPKVIIFKDRTNTNGWHFYHGSFGATDLLLLDATNSLLTGNSYMNSTLPTSSLISLGNSGGVNGSSANYIAYCFAEKKGYSKFGSYTGNGNSDGTFVYTGFKPAWIMIKRTDASGHYWHIYDNKREPFNPVGKVLYPNRSDSEFAGSNRPDLLSNGFKNRSGNTDINASGGNYIYMAFAENPFVTGASAIPTTAR
jgi:hypothetical protein